MYSFNFLDQFSSLSISIVVFFLIMVSFYIGIRLRKYSERKRSVEERSIGALEASLLGLLALLLILYLQYEQQPARQTNQHNCGRSQ